MVDKLILDDDVSTLMLRGSYFEIKATHDDWLSAHHMIVIDG